MTNNFNIFKMICDNFGKHTKLICSTIKHIVDNKTKLSVVKFIIDHPELSDEKVKHITKMF